MTSLNRRRLLAGIAGIATLTALPAFAKTRTKPRVLVIGGGIAGTAAAKTIAHGAPNAEVLLFEPNQEYRSAMGSGKVATGFQDPASLVHSYERLNRRDGILVVPLGVEVIEPELKRLRLSDGTITSYDYVVVAPGIDLRFEQDGGMAGFDAQSAALSAGSVMHAWKGGRQAQTLFQRLVAMDDGQTVVMALPEGRISGSLAPYERASLIAQYFKVNKPRSKVVILDPKDDFEGRAIFETAWARHTPGMVEWVPAARGGRAVELDARSGAVRTADGIVVKADLINVIPRQWAGAVARRSGLVDKSGWAPVNPMSHESQLRDGVYVVGDAAVVDPLRASGAVALSHGRAAALAVLAGIHGYDPKLVRPVMHVLDVQYAQLSPREALVRSFTYRLDKSGATQVSDAGNMEDASVTIGALESASRQAAAFHEDVHQSSFG